MVWSYTTIKNFRGDFIGYKFVDGPTSGLYNNNIIASMLQIYRVLF